VLLSTTSLKRSVVAQISPVRRFLALVVYFYPFGYVTAEKPFSDDVPSCHQ